MVATRRMVSNDPDELAVGSSDKMLSKRPLRKPAAESTTAKAIAAPKGRTTRAKEAQTIREELGRSNIEPETQTTKPTRKTAGRPKKDDQPEQIEAPATSTRAMTGSIKGRKFATQDQEEHVLPVAEKPKAARPAKAATGRSRKTAGPALNEDPTNAPATVAPTRSNRTGSVRFRKLAVAVEDPPALPMPRQKATRATRATAARAPPLSPKKITQVSKPAARTTRAAKGKVAANASSVNAPPVVRITTRQRTVSDENAELPALELEVNEDDAIAVSSPTVEATPRPVRGESRSGKAASETSMSSRPTTPNDSTLPSFAQDDEVENAAENGMLTEDEDEEQEQQIASERDASEDELCGPKTPLKRASPGAEARYLSSVQRTFRHYEDQQRMHTPARRYNVLGTQRGTPQTQKPYCKPAAPSSEVRPMTVARGSGRACVSRDLSEGAPELAESDNDHPGEEDAHEVAESDDVDMQEEPSFVVDDNVIPLDFEGLDDLGHDSVGATCEVSIQVEQADLSADDVIDEQPIVATSLEFDAPMADVEKAEGFVAPAFIERDPDETVLDGETPDGNESDALEQPQTFETDETVIITRPSRQHEVQDVHEEYVDESHNEGSVLIYDVSMISEHAPPHETQATITINFDDLFSSTRNTTVQNDIAASDGGPLTTSSVCVAGVGRAIDDVHLADDALAEAGSRRQTVNWDEFIDVAALADPIEARRLSSAEMFDQVSEFDANRAKASTVSNADEEVPMEVQTDADNERRIQSLQFEASLVVDNPTPATNHAFDGEAASSQNMGTEEVAEEVEEQKAMDLPHYALPTIAFDARRKSLPAFSHYTPVRTGNRPHTSDGASIPRVLNPFGSAWWSTSRAASAASTPVRARPSTAHGTSHAASPSKTPLATPEERFPRLAPRAECQGHAMTVAAPHRFQNFDDKPVKRRETCHKAATGRTVAHAPSTVSSPAKTPLATPKERFPRLAPRSDYEGHASTVAAPSKFRDVNDKPEKRRETFHRAATGRTIASIPKTVPSEAQQTPESVKITQVDVETPTTPTVTPMERYPRLRPREDQADHAKTVAAPVRFRTPVKTPLQRPATAKKPESLRKAALKASTPLTSRTTKTPLKAPAETPGQVPMTPHPAAPLQGIVAMVEVFTLEGASASAPFVALLHRLGAKTTKVWSERVTHIIFKDGSPTTLQRVRLHNKDVEQKASGTMIHCVNSRWVTDCEADGSRMDETDEVYAVDIAEIPRGGKRRRKSMEPSALLNLGGNIVRDPKSSMSRKSSLGRSPLKFDVDSPTVADTTTTPLKDTAILDKENSPDGVSSPATPAWIAAPDQLVQQTAPLNRIRKLNLPGKEGAKSRRLTFWNGGA